MFVRGFLCKCSIISLDFDIFGSTNAIIHHIMPAIFSVVRTVPCKWKRARRNLLTGVKEVPCVVRVRILSIFICLCRKRRPFTQDSRLHLLPAPTVRRVRPQRTKRKSQSRNINRNNSRNRKRRLLLTPQLKPMHTQTQPRTIHGKVWISCTRHCRQAQTRLISLRKRPPRACLAPNSPMSRPLSGSKGKDLDQDKHKDKEGFAFTHAIAQSLDPLTHAVSALQQNQLALAEAIEHAKSGSVAGVSSSTAPGTHAETALTTLPSLCSLSSPLSASGTARMLARLRC